jgi:hypothetical protein
MRGLNRQTTIVKRSNRFFLLAASYYSINRFALRQPILIHNIPKKILGPSVKTLEDSQQLKPPRDRTMSVPAILGTE